jgi:hypothetical protein
MKDTMMTLIERSSAQVLDVEEADMIWTPLRKRV